VVVPSFDFEKLSRLKNYTDALRSTRHKPRKRSAAVYTFIHHIYFPAGEFFVLFAACAPFRQCWLIPSYQVLNNAKYAQIKPNQHIGAYAYF
jgi:hypothetical protein